MTHRDGQAVLRHCLDPQDLCSEGNGNGGRMIGVFDYLEGLGDSLVEKGCSWAAWHPTTSLIK